MSQWKLNDISYSQFNLFVSSNLMPKYLRHVHKKLFYFSWSMLFDKLIQFLIVKGLSISHKGLSDDLLYLSYRKAIQPQVDLLRLLQVQRCL